MSRRNENMTLYISTRFSSLFNHQSILSVNIVHSRNKRNKYE